MLFFVVIFDFNFEMMTDVGKASIGWLQGTDGSTSNLLFSMPIMMLSITFDFFMLLAIFIFDLISVCFGVVRPLSLLVVDSFNIFFVLQIQKHRFLLLHMNDSS